MNGRLPGRSALVAIVTAIALATGANFTIGFRTLTRLPVAVVARSAISIPVAIAPWATIATAARAAIVGLRRRHLAGDRRAAGKADLPVRRDIGHHHRDLVVEVE